MAARPRTLPAAIAPVLVGTAAAVEASDDFRARRLRRGPGRLRSSSRSAPTSPTTTRTPGAAPTPATGWARCASRPPAWSPPRRVLVATWLAFGVAVAAGLYLADRGRPVILVVGAASILAGVLYTGGPRPYGYAGLGELFVFLFFGLVAVNGSYYVQLEELDWLPFGLSVSGRAAGHRDPGGQQRPRHRHRPPRRQADARGAAGPRADARASTRCWSASPSWPFWSTLVAAGGPAWALLALLSVAARHGRRSRRCCTRTDGPSLNAALARDRERCWPCSALLLVGRAADLAA